MEQPPRSAGFEPVSIRLSGRDRWIFVAGGQLRSAEKLVGVAADLRAAGKHYGLQQVFENMAKQCEQEAERSRDAGRRTLLRLVNEPPVTRPPSPINALTGKSIADEELEATWWRRLFRRGRGGV